MSRRLLMSVAVLPFAMPLAYAQDAAEPDLIQDTIIVSTPGKARTADELIGNATAVSRDELLEKLGGTLGDTLEHLPGVSSTHFGAGASRPVLRGLGAERVQVLTNGLGVIDVSAASPDHQVAADGIDAEKVEVLRGPAALAYGGQAIGGVVNVIDGRISETLPSEPIEFDAFVANNSVNEGLEGAAQVKATAGNFVFSLSASARDFDNYEIPGFAESAAFRAAEEEEHDHEDEDHDEDEDHEGEEHDHEEEEEAYGELPNSFLETQTISAGVSYVGERGFFGVAVRQQTSEYGLPGHSHHHEEEHHDEEGEDHDEGEDHEDEHEHEEGEENPFIDYEQIRVDVRGGLDVDLGIINRLNGSFAYADYEHTEFEGPGEVGTLYDTSGYEGRLELDNAFAGFEGAFGLQFFDKEFNAFGEEAFISPTDTSSLGVFIYEAREWDSGVGVEGGLRIESVELDNQDQGSVDFDLVSASVGVHKHMNDSLFLGGQISLAQRAPNETELFADGVHVAVQRFERGDATLDVESGLNFEGTARWKLGAGQISINAFYTDYSDFIFALPGEVELDGVLVDEVEENPVVLFMQQDAEFIGFELQGGWELGEIAGGFWNVDASMDYVDAEFANDDSVPYIPPVTFRTALEGEWNAFSANVELEHALKQEEVGPDNFDVDAYTRVDVGAALRLGAFNDTLEGSEIFVELRNATDEEIRYATSVLRDQVPAQGRNLRIGARLSF